mmetsp:Transcript_64999/g.209373  ORF Transcript_64999/g.209373 Transcript_64999/m.209373 type:complete len:206 (-) Transcript_64999:459-1076(-)
MPSCSCRAARLRSCMTAWAPPGEAKKPRPPACARPRTRSRRQPSGRPPRPRAPWPVCERSCRRSSWPSGLRRSCARRRSARRWRPPRAATCWRRRRWRPAPRCPNRPRRWRPWLRSQPPRPPQSWMRLPRRVLPACLSCSSQASCRLRGGSSPRSSLCAATSTSLGASSGSRRWRLRARPARCRWATSAPSRGRRARVASWTWSC